MDELKVLDCTLRDGGYINDWEFGEKNIVSIAESLFESGIEFVECGFLSDKSYNADKSLYDEISRVDNLFKKVKKKHSKMLAMIVFGKFNPSKIIPKTNSVLDGIRVTFKKHELNEAFELCRKIKEAGYLLFINPTNIDSYTEEEIIAVTELANQIKPFAFSVVDTLGVLKKNNLLQIFSLINKNLDKDIQLCFHSHNNLQLSFSNALELINNADSRKLIIDSSVFGMGRGAGNICSELLTQYINDNYNGNYNLIPILKIIDEHINKIFTQTPWGYSVPFYLAAINSCHPNYASFLSERQTITVDLISKILQKIPDGRKHIYDKVLIQNIYSEFQENNIEDSKDVEKLRKLLADRNILLLASGKSLVGEKEKIDEFIKRFNPFIISLNFVPDYYNCDLAFITNTKRFNAMEKINVPYVTTSNIKEVTAKNGYKLNYSSYLNTSQLNDNTALMCLSFLNSIGIKAVNLAGLDGFKRENSENYFKDSLITNKVPDKIEAFNLTISKELQKISKSIEINFVTKSIYTL